MARGPRPIVLVVDDDASVRSALSRGLGRAGYDVRLAEDGESGANLAREIHPDVVLLDVVMPGGPDGFQVCRRLQASEELSYIPVIFVTALESQEDEARAFAAGASGYIRKPFETADLLATMEEHLAKRERWEGLRDPSVHWTDWFVPATFEEFKRFLLEQRRASQERRAEVTACTPERLFDLARILNLPEEQVSRYVSRFLGLPFVNRVHAEDLALGVLPRSFCEKNLVVPVRGLGTHTGVVLANPFQWELLESLNRSVWRNHTPDVSLTTPDTIRRLFEDPEDRVIQVPSLEEASARSGGRGSPVPADGQVLQIANELLRGAVDERASDIHFEPKDRFTLVRFRIDGDMHDVRTLESSDAARLISRFKALSGMDIAEKRKPQDGSVEVQVGRNRLKLRLATSSTSDGETLVVRLLEPTRSALPLEKLGMAQHQADEVAAMINRHQGMIMVVGPTGSGKSTTIFSLLSRVDGRTRSIMSVEDPVEYRIPFANQQQVNERAGVTFEALLRSAMRQDPDVLFLGEVRDAFSAKASLDFASSGHLTVSTLHAANATTAIFRLERLGIQRPGMADSILGVVAQKLVKKLCPNCRVVRPIEEAQAAMLYGFTEELPTMVAHPGRCPACRETGYLGREGVYEILRFDPTLSEMVRSGASINRIRSHCIQRGDYMMYDHAVDKVRDLTFAVADVHAQVLLDELRFRQASQARSDLGLDDGKGDGAAVAPRAAVAPLATLDAVEVPRPTVSPPSAPASPPAPTAAPGETRGSGPEEAARILLAEDDATTQTLVEAILKAAGYQVTVAPDGLDALWALGQQEYDAVVSDINMPNLGGMELLAMLKNKGVEIPVLFITGEASEDTEAQVFAAGAEDFIRKPIRPDVLVGRVKNVLRRTKKAAQAV